MFEEIPDTRVPFVYVEFDAARAQQGAAIQPYRILVIGQKLSAGSVEALTPVQVTQPSQAKSYFGAGSMLARMLEKLLANNTVTQTWAVALDDDGGAAQAAGEILFGGTVASGTVNLYIGGRRVKVSVAASDTLADIASNTVDAITADADLPVTAAVNGTTPEQVDLTAKNGGEAGNDIDIRHSYFTGEALPDGLTVTVTPMAGGSGNPDISTVWAAIGDTQYNVLAVPYTDTANLDAVDTELADRWTAQRMIEGHAITAATGTHAELITLGDGRNGRHVSIMSAAASPTPPDEWAGAVAGVASFHGQLDPARPFQTLEVNGVLAPEEADRFTRAENDLLLRDGISTHDVDAGGNVLIQRLITTYQENTLGAPDTAYLDVNTMLTLSYLRWDFRNYILLKYPRHKLADDGVRVGPGQDVMTPKLGRAEAIARFRMWEELGLVEGGDQFKQDLIVERDGTDPNRLNFILPPDLINQLRVTAVKIAFLL
ncbi:MAG: phage tail sheath subtilisin-like domain-containing protein [Alphaproteobacteria bacterium]